MKYPNLKVCVSSFARVNSIEKAKYWEEFGADRITLDYTTMNRNFRQLREIRKAVKCKIQLIANNSCLYFCPFVIYHDNIVSHASQSGDYLKGFIVDYCLIACRFKRIRNPVEFIRSGWIRPDDVSYYHDIGIDSIKLVDRGRPTEEISSIVKAYVNGRYRGNLIDLFPLLSGKPRMSISDKIHVAKYLFRPLSINILKFKRIAELLAERVNVYIDNRALDGFIDYFLKEDCTLKACQECLYCEKIAKQVIKIEPAYQEEMISKYESAIKTILSGEIFKCI